MGNNTENQVGLLAFLEVQKAIPAIKRTETAHIPTKGGGSYAYEYADLYTVLKLITPILNKNGFILTQPTKLVDGKQVLETNLIHVSGYMHKGEIILPDFSTQEMRAQELGSLITYFRRYSLVSILGINIENEDDDGAAASTGNPASEKQKEFIIKLCKEKNINQDQLKILLAEQKSTWGDMSSFIASKVIKKLQA